MSAAVVEDLTPTPRTGWEPVPGHPGYVAHRDGLIRGPSGRVLSPGNNGNGYLRVQLRAGGKTEYVHRIVALTFIGPIEGRDVDHIDNDRSNNAASNLQIVTRSRHAELGVSRRPTCGRGHPMAEGKGRRYCPTCARDRDTRRVR